MQRKLITLLITTACLLGRTLVADTYSTEATMSVQKDEGTYNVDVRVSRLLDKDGKTVEQLIEAPRITSGPGVPGTLYTGPKLTDPDYATKENVTVDVSWPYPNETGIAFCAVTIRRGNTIVSKSKFQLKVEGPGRAPLVLAVQDVSPKSVRVEAQDPNSPNNEPKTFVLLEFSKKTKAEVKKMAIENYGNRVQVRDSQGRLTEGGLSFGTYHDTGLALDCNSEDEAKHVASILRGEPAK
jgi:hypothetical protein